VLRAALILITLAAPPAYAETYKWVDANGVVNYSNTPPPAGTLASNPQTVPDRVSSYTPEPALSQPIEVYRRLDATEAEWLQRQRIMAMQQAQTMAPASEAASTYYPAVPFYVVRRPHIVRPAFFAPKPAVARPVARASLSRL
jgi:hypothetical protein